MLIGISGKIGSGKDTIGKIIQYLVWKSRVEKGELPLSVYSFSDFARETSFGKNQSNFEIKKYADKLKDFVCMLIGCTREQLEDREFKEKELGEEWYCYIFNNGKKEELTLDFETARILSCDNRVISRTMTPRELLQIIGTECIRDKVHPNAWVNALMSEYKPIEVIEPISKENKAKYKVGFAPENQLSLQYPNWIITDMRFPNELEAVKSKGGITIRVNRTLPCGAVQFNGTQEEWEELVKKNKEQNAKFNQNQFHPSETSLDSATFDFVISNDKDIEHLINEVRKILKKLNSI